VPKKNFTDRYLASLKPAIIGTRYEVWDQQAPGLGIRINHKPKSNGWAQGHYIYVATFPGGRNPVRRTIGPFGVLSLAKARETARGWREMIAGGKDPQVEAERQEREQARRRQITFAAVAEDFIAEKLPGERKGPEVARDIRRDLIPKLGKRPVTDIERIDIRNLIKEKKASAPAQARNLLGYAKRLFSWAVDQEVYGLDHSPCSEIRAKEIIGERRPAERVLSDDELFALWHSALKQGYPYGTIYQVLMLNALRLNEAADACGPEFNFGKREWIIPAARMKGREATARAHAVPLTEETLKIIGTMPEFKKGKYLFSLNFGESPVWMNTKVKRRIDANMLAILNQLAAKRGEDPTAVQLEPWVNHDIRRSVRTNMSPLKNNQGVRIADEVKEAILAHVRPGIKGVYDRYEYFDEKKEALDLWAARLTEIVDPSPAEPQESNVLVYRGKRVRS
jgi:hypothetical protein